MVLTQQDGAQAGTLIWRLARFVQVGVDIGLFGIEWLSPVCAGEKSGDVLVLNHSDPECAYVLNLQSGLATKVAGLTRSFNYMIVVPYEINWSMFFMSRLGVRL
uniref:Uncharacterized protein n=1 Tax=Arundo donax TaxID=35708 RepID=A0A0A9DTS0_ARUDO